MQPARRNSGVGFEWRVAERPRQVGGARVGRRTEPIKGQFTLGVRVRRTRVPGHGLLFTLLPTPGWFPRQNSQSGRGLFPDFSAP